MQDDDAAGATYGLLYQNGSIKPNAGYDAYHNFITANPWPARYSVCDVEYSPDGGTFSNSVEVTLSSLTDQVEIHYTTDGTVPSLYSPLYTGPITISTTTTIKALAWKDGWDRSILTSATFVIN
jgi:N-acetyl-beta-hexosaminidase